MDAVTGKDFQVADAVYAYQLDGEGGITPIREDSQATAQTPCWLHLDYIYPASAEWLAKTPLLPDAAREALSGGSLRPRISRQGEGMLVTLRGINSNQDAKRDLLVTIRLYITDKFMISSRHRKVYSMDEVIDDLHNGVGATDSGSWLVSISDALTDHTAQFIGDLHDKIIDMEDVLLDQKTPERGELAQVRKQLIVLRRYMAPQRDVFARLASERLPWMQDDDRRRMQEIADRLGRGLDDLDASVARTAVLADEISAVIADAMNRRTYTMSLMAMLFLPATFLTGLFGVNLGGIPGNEWRYGFATFSLLLILIGAVVAFALKRRKWL